MHNDRSILKSAQRFTYLSPSAHCCVCRLTPAPPHHVWLTPSPCQYEESDERTFNRNNHKIQNYNSNTTMYMYHYQNHYYYGIH